MTQKTEAKIALGTWSWESSGFAGGDAVFGNQLDTADLKDVFNTAMENGLNVLTQLTLTQMVNLNVFLVNFLMLMVMTKSLFQINLHQVCKMMQLKIQLLIIAKEV